MSQESAVEQEPAAEAGATEGQLESLMKDYEEWLAGQSEPRSVKVSYDEEEDLWEIDLGDEGAVVAYSSEIDSEFYGEGTAVFLECELGPPDPQTDLSKLLRFSGQELVLSRISLSERDAGEHVLVVEAACPYSQIDFDLLDLMIREVAAIANDVRDLLEGKTS